jgi:hypothetical protein
MGFSKNSQEWFVPPRCFMNDTSFIDMPVEKQLSKGSVLVKAAGFRERFAR